MVNNNDVAELLFFDTFSHETDTDINLDLVQFPKPVYLTQIRIIPLGARVQADFPGGVRLGATNPSKFDVEFFVNDLGVPGASTFDILGTLEYNQNDCIHLECTRERIPTDGLVLRGWYSTITLAVYGIRPDSMAEAIVNPAPLPLEPAAPVEIRSENVINRDAVMQEDAIKDEWREPLSGEVVAQAHKSNVSDYERDDLEYGRSRGEHYHQSGDERERRLRKTSHSSERSIPSRNRTHSESNERDYLRSSRGEREREKHSRDWSRSPEYSRRSRRKRSERSRSEAEDAHKWPPRTPPASIDSPTRPRSPDNMDYPDEDVHYKLKSRNYVRSNESLTNGPTDTQILDDEDTPGTPGEQYEPILSDDEIVGDDDSTGALEQAAGDEMEIEVQAAAAAAGPAIIDFDPFMQPITKYVDNLYGRYGKELESLRMILKKFSFQTKCNSLSSFTAPTTTVEERESFVYLSEQLINQLAYLAQQFKRRNFVLQEFFNSDPAYLPQMFNILVIALEFECACLQQQPAFKIRHIKVGARLTELLGASHEFLDHVLNVKNFDPFAALFKLYQEDYMALSIKLMLLKAVYALLDSKIGIRYFLSGSKLNGYQLLLNVLQQSHLTRTKYSIQAIIKKLHLSEALECVRGKCNQLFVLHSSTDIILNEHFMEIEDAVGQILDSFTGNALSYQQPKRFLPVSKKFQISADPTAQRNFANTLQAYFNQHSLGESLLLILSNADMLPESLLQRCLDLLGALLQTHIGIDYLVDDCFETTQMIVAVLLGIEEIPQEETTSTACDDEIKTKTEKCGKPKEEMSDANEAATSVSNATTRLIIPPVGIVENVKDADTPTEEKTLPISLLTSAIQNVRKPLYNKLQNLGIELAFKVQTRYHLDAITCNAITDNYDTIKLATHLHALYSQTCHSPSRQYTVEVICINNNMQIFMDLIQREQRLLGQRQMTSPGTKYKSPVLSYAVDMVDCCVRYSEQLDYLVEHGVRILELAKNHETFDPSVSAVLQELFIYLKPLEVVNIFDYDDITPLVEVITRSLEYITTFPGDLIMGLRILRHLAIGCNDKSFNASNTEELKHRFVTLQFYAADGVQTLIQILERLCSYFEQPGLHVPALMTIQGVHCSQIILPTLQILRTMLSYAIQCRDVHFKDLTAIDHLMKSYYLLHYFPATSQVYNNITQAKYEIIQTLLAYTQPNEQDEESLHKSLWTQMVREILKSIDGPATFIPGLQVISELLPLPLPIPLPANTQLAEAQTLRLITERRLWSAHLHPQSTQIAKLIETIAPSSFPPLVELITKVCLQLADLAPNMTLLISKTLCDLVCAEWQSSSAAPTAHLARLLHFFARLTAFASLKISALSIFSGKLWDLFQSILNIAEAEKVAYSCQLAVHHILESFLNVDISLISPKFTATPELNLVSALPPKELIPRIIDALFVNLFSADVKQELCKLALDNLTKLAAHDYTLYHLMIHLKQKRTEFQQWLQRYVAFCETGQTNTPESVDSLITFLHVLTHPVELKQPPIIPARILKMSVKDLSLLLGFQLDSKPHTLQRISTAFSETGKPQLGDMPKSLLNELIMRLESCESCTVEVDEDLSAQTEPAMPQSEGIVMQFAARPIFTEYNALGDDSYLSTRYWLQASCMEVDEAQCERISCDLTDLAADCLSAETNLTTDCKRVLHLSASPQSNRERTPTANCFRTRRVEVEPSTGRPEKKIYITPVRGRGFSRAPPSRGDLFRSRPPNTSRPPSLHVDDFLALETCGAQPTGPTGYNKIPPLMRGSRVGRNRGSRISSSVVFRKSKVLRTSSPSTWNDSGSPHYRTVTSEPHFGETHYSPSPHFSGRSRGRGGRGRSYLR